MSPRKDCIPHELRTAAEPRQNKLHTVRLTHIEQINPTVRLLRLTLPSSSTSRDESSQQHQEPFAFLPGQWLDVHIPSIPQAGGFTITSTPADAQFLPSPEPVLQTGSDPRSTDAEGIAPTDAPSGRLPYVELAVQKAPSSPPAAWLWRPEEEIMGKELNVRVGGSFIWPPTDIAIDQIRNVVFVAGGVGINPLIAMLSHLSERESSDAPTSLPLPDKNRNDPLSIHFLYSTRLPSEKTTSSSGHQQGRTDLNHSTLLQILFLPRLRQIVQRASSQPSNLHISLDLFLTNLPSNASAASAVKMLRDGDREGDEDKDGNIRVYPRRITHDDLQTAATTNTSGSDEVIPPENTVCYVCGPPPMTDGFVEFLRGIVGEKRVLCEKWW